MKETSNKVLEGVLQKQSLVVCSVQSAVWQRFSHGTSPCSRSGGQLPLWQNTSYRVKNTVKEALALRTFLLPLDNP
jgi:hypothetical protein